MSITHIDDDGFKQVCAACGNTRHIAVCDVEVRAPETGQARVALALPECLLCHSVELLLPATRAEATRVHPHQLLVDLIAVRCGHAAMTEELEAEIAEAFPSGLRMDAPVSDARTAEAPAAESATVSLDG